MSYLLEIKHRGGANTTQKLDTEHQVGAHLDHLMQQDNPIEVRVFKCVRIVRRRDVWDTISEEPSA